MRSVTPGELADDKCFPDWPTRVHLHRFLRVLERKGGTTPLQAARASATRRLVARPRSRTQFRNRLRASAAAQRAPEIPISLWLSIGTSLSSSCLMVMICCDAHVSLHTMTKSRPLMPNRKSIPAKAARPKRLAGSGCR